jgi:hypothetical protein
LLKRLRTDKGILKQACRQQAIDLGKSNYASITGDAASIGASDFVCPTCQIYHRLRQSDR